MEREILLGYLMNALDDDEIGIVEGALLRNPSLHNELAQLRTELLPLAVASREEYLPPSGLAERTCAKIWANVDKRNVPTITLNRFRLLDGEAEPGPQVPAQCTVQPVRSRGRRKLVDLAASVAVGILIAVIAFPVINYVKQQTERVLLHSRMKGMEQSGFLAILDGTPTDNAAAQGGISLATSAWQEVHPNRLPLLPVIGGTPFGADSLPGDPQLFRAVADRSPLIDDRTIFLGQETLRPATVGMPYHPLLADIERAISISNGSLVHPAYGQNVLFQDGRVYFRVLPIFQDKDE